MAAQARSSKLEQMQCELHDLAVERAEMAMLKKQSEESKLTTTLTCSSIMKQERI